MCPRYAGLLDLDIGDRYIFTLDFGAGNRPLQTPRAQNHSIDGAGRGGPHCCQHRGNFYRRGSPGQLFIAGRVGCGGYFGRDNDAGT